MAILHELQRIFANPGVWITVVLLNVAVVTTVAILIRKKLSRGLQWVLVMAAIWVVWLPLVTGGELAIPYQSPELISHVLRTVGTYLSLGCAFLCARITLTRGHGFVLLIALIEVLVIIAIALTSLYGLVDKFLR